MEASMFPRRPDYLLKVRGMSMRDAGIIDGDLLAVQRAKDAKNGQIVVARIGDEVTVKRFRRTRHGIELIPENPDFETLVIPTTGVDAGDLQFELEGLAVGLIRNNMMM
jgi:repressor LexA